MGKEVQDHLTRGAMCSLMLQGWSQGEALKQAIEEHAIEWKISTMRMEQQLVDERELHHCLVARPPAPGAPQRGRP